MMKYYFDIINDILKSMLNTNNHFLIHSLYSILSKLISRKSDRQTASRMRPENYHKRRHGFQRGFILPNYSIFIRYRLHKNKRLSLYIYIFISPRLESSMTSIVEHGESFPRYSINFTRTFNSSSILETATNPPRTN